MCRCRTGGVAAAAGLREHAYARTKWLPLIFRSIEPDDIDPGSGIDKMRVDVRLRFLDIAQSPGKDGF
jgi:hypothetical protein